MPSTLPQQVKYFVNKIQGDIDTSAKYSLERDEDDNSNTIYLVVKSKKLLEKSLDFITLDRATVLDCARREDEIYEREWYGDEGASIRRFVMKYFSEAEKRGEWHPEYWPTG